mmetsp:Transcript_8597/g.25775  ORF Transcript_8597/g.25775 Transcript_8597/m.25775 type:complete len:157 (+) Transcript_8597:346-816(+)
MQEAAAKSQKYSNTVCSGRQATGGGLARSFSSCSCRCCIQVQTTCRNDIVPAATARTAAGARSYCAPPSSSSSSNADADASNSDSSVSDRRHGSANETEGATKVCLSPNCGQAWELRYFKPNTAEVDGLSPLCDGCRCRFFRYRRLITKSGMSEAQ